jgi:hypothetical protein
MGCGADVGLGARPARAERGGPGASSPLWRYLARCGTRRTTHRLVQVAASNGLVRACAGAVRRATCGSPAVRAVFRGTERRRYAADAHDAQDRHRAACSAWILFPAVVVRSSGSPSFCARSPRIRLRMSVPTTVQPRAQRGTALYPEGQDVNGPRPTSIRRSSPCSSDHWPCCRSRWQPPSGDRHLLSFLATLWLLGIRRRATWLAVGILGVPIGFALAVAQLMR